MAWKWWDRLRGESEPPEGHFEPIYSLQEIEAFGRLPILRVLAFAGDSEQTGNGQIGPGVGGILASLLRRDLGFVRQVSVIAGEDTGFLGPSGFGMEDAEILDSFPEDIVIAGEIRTHSPSAGLVRIRVLRRGEQQAPENTFEGEIQPNKLPALMPTIANQVCDRLGLQRSSSTTERWRHHTLTDWQTLKVAAVCWETNDVRPLATLLETGKIHPDGMSGISADGYDRDRVRTALAKANEREPDNAQIAFATFIAQCNFHQKPVDPRFEKMLRAGLQATPGHGKSHMVLPHILMPIQENLPYILAHSEVGYRLLRNNTFALSNFCDYLMHYAPDDQRIPRLHAESIDLDPEHPFGYYTAIKFYLQHNRPAEALPFAHSLVRLCTPPVSERTWYCFQQYPTIAKLINEGNFNPQRFAEDTLKLCVAALQRDGQ